MARPTHRDYNTPILPAPLQVTMPNTTRPNPPWNDSKDKVLAKLFTGGYSFADIADNLKEHNLGNIRKRLVFLGLMRTIYNDPRESGFRNPWVPGEPLPPDIDADELSELTLLPRRSVLKSKRK